MYRDSSLCDVSVMFWGFCTWPPNQNHPCIITLQYMYSVCATTLYSQTETHPPHPHKKTPKMFDLK